jgi:tripartite-type tricarboxylate transporter receptor subunit TctC
VPYLAGSASDVVARMLVEPMRRLLGQPVVIENVGGATGTIGVGRVARAAPDGYTLSLGNNGSHILSSAIYPVQYDLLTDFEPVALISAAPLLLAARKTMPANDLKGLITWLKANPDKATQGNVGTGGTTHIAGVSFQRETGTRAQFVPYRSSGLLTQDLMAGQIDLAFTDLLSALPQVRAGAIKAFGVSAKTRLGSAPDIPTLDEAGLPEFEMRSWNGLWLPKGTPKSVVIKLNAAVVDACDSAMRARLADLGLEVFPRDRQTPEALGEFQKAEIEKWWPIIRAANIKGE